MSLLDKVAAAVMPPESAEDRAEARRNAEACAAEAEFIGLALDHHRQIERTIAAALASSDAAGRRAAMKELATILTGHANAEESVLYPAMAAHDEKAHAAMAYQEQAMTKVEMGLLETLDPLSREWTEKLEHIQGALKHHMYQEEGTWFPELAESVPAPERARLTERYREEYERYAGPGAMTGAG